MEQVESNSELEAQVIDEAALVNLDQLESAADKLAKENRPEAVKFETADPQDGSYVSKASGDREPFIPSEEYQQQQAEKKAIAEASEAIDQAIDEPEDYELKRATEYKITLSLSLEEVNGCKASHSFKILKSFSAPAETVLDNIKTALMSKRLEDYINIQAGEQISRMDYAVKKTNATPKQLSLVIEQTAEALSMEAATSEPEPVKPENLGDETAEQLEEPLPNLEGDEAGCAADLADIKEF